MNDYLAAAKIPAQQVPELVDQMRAIGICAIIRDYGATRVVGVGIGDNESGLILMNSESPVPAVGTKQADGREFTIIEEVAPGVFFYETT